MIEWRRRDRDNTVITLDGARLVELRLSRAMSQDELAEALGCGRSTVSMWETEGACPTLPQIKRLRRVFGDALEAVGAVVIFTTTEKSK
jgi:predicted transcriptional regulator